MAGARRWAAPLWSVLLAVLLLGGALGPGYVLSYDMVWVPDLAVTPDVWGVGTALPRAVPSDAVVAVLDTVIPGMLLRDGKVVAAGLLDDVMTAEPLSETFGLPLTVERRAGGRFTAYRRR